MKIIGECNNNSKVRSVAQNISWYEMFICLTNVFRLYSIQKGTCRFSSIGSRGFACILFSDSEVWGSDDGGYKNLCQVCSEVETAASSETSVNFYKTTRQHIIEDNYPRAFNIRVFKTRCVSDYITKSYRAGEYTLL